MKTWSSGSGATSSISAPFSTRNWHILGCSIAYCKVSLVQPIEVSVPFTCNRGVPQELRSLTEASPWLSRLRSPSISPFITNSKIGASSGHVLPTEMLGHKDRNPSAIACWWKQTVRLVWNCLGSSIAFTMAVNCVIFRRVVVCSWNKFEAAKHCLFVVVITTFPYAVSICFVQCSPVILPFRSVENRRSVLFY